MLPAEPVEPWLCAAPEPTELVRGELVVKDALPAGKLVFGIAATPYPDELQGIPLM